MRTHKLILLLMTFSVMMYAQAGPGPMHKMIKMTGPQRCGGCAGMTGLTEEQKEKIESMKVELQKSLNPVKSELSVAAAELKKLMIADNTNQSAIDKKVEEIGKLRTDMQKLEVTNQLKIRKLLNDEQKVAFDKRILEGDCNGGGLCGAPMKKIIKIHRMNGEDGPCEMEIEEEVEEMN